MRLCLWNIIKCKFKMPLHLKFRVKYLILSCSLTLFLAEHIQQCSENGKNSYIYLFSPFFLFQQNNLGGAIIP
jgi:hypothetical protein